MSSHDGTFHSCLVQILLYSFLRCFSRCRSNTTIAVLENSASELRVSESPSLPKYLHRFLRLFGQITGIPSLAGVPRMRCKNNINMELREVGSEDV